MVGAGMAVNQMYEMLGGWSRAGMSAVEVDRAILLLRSVSGDSTDFRDVSAEYNLQRIREHQDRGGDSMCVTGLITNGMVNGERPDTPLTSLFDGPVSVVEQGEPVPAVFGTISAPGVTAQETAERIARARSRVDEIAARAAESIVRAVEDEFLNGVPGDPYRGLLGEPMGDEQTAEAITRLLNMTDLLEAEAAEAVNLIGNEYIRGSYFLNDIASFEEAIDLGDMTRERMTDIVRAHLIYLGAEDENAPEYDDEDDPSPWWVAVRELPMPPGNEDDGDDGDPNGPGIDLRRPA
jgi:hypothetical protein